MGSLPAPSRVGKNITCEARYHRGCDLVFAKLPNAQLKVQCLKRKLPGGVRIETEGTVPEGFQEQVSHVECQVSECEVYSLQDLQEQKLWSCDQDGDCYVTTWVPGQESRYQERIMSWHTSLYVQRILEQSRYWFSFYIREQNNSGFNNLKGLCLFPIEN